MNRTILILICDFLLVSLLAFSTADINKTAEEGAQPTPKVDLFTNQVAESGKDLAGVMRVALEDERRSRDRLLGELVSTREDLAGQRALLVTREKEVQSFRQELLSKEQQAALLHQEQTNLQQRLSATQGNLQALNQQFRATAADATTSKERLAAMEAEMRAAADQATALQQQISTLAQSNQVVFTQKQQLAARLQTAEVERRYANEQTAKLEEQVKVEREEKAKLAEGVKVLATKSSDLELEVREKLALLAAREKQVGSLQQEVLSKEQQTSLLAQEQTNLQQRLIATQGNLQALNQQLHATAVDATISKERLAAMEAEMRKQADQAAALQQQISTLAQSNQVVVAQKQQLATQLQVAEVERRHANEDAAKLTEQVKVERAEKSKLAEGVKLLAANSGDLGREIRQNRPLASNTIYSEFLTNRVQAQFSASRSSIFWDTSKRRATQTVLVSNGTNTYALCHVQDTPFTFFNPGTEWEGLTGTLSHGKLSVPIRSLSFALQDPRIVIIPIDNAHAKQMGCNVYSISADPFKFQDAVLVGDSYYGECQFQIDPTAPGYLKLDNNFLKGLFGKFNPSRGDLVFSRTGELMGVMANSSYCMRLQGFDAAATFRFGSEIGGQRTGIILSMLYSSVAELPSKLQ